MSEEEDELGREVVNHSCISDFQPRYGKGGKRKASKRMRFKIFYIIG